MPQNVPPFEWTEEAVKVREFVYEFWCEHGVGPNLRDIHEATALSRWRIVQALKQLQLGIICVVDEDTQNCNIIKFQPFSSFPSQVKAYIDGEFHSYVGCAMEAMAFPKMPPFAGKEVRLESWCACCFSPVTLISRDGEPVSQTPESVAIHISTTPYEWGNVDIVRMCDSMNFVLDADHAERYEKQISRRGVVVALDQARLFVADTARNRMHDPHWKPSQMIPHVIIKGMGALGVDTTNWTGDKQP
jgi:hypothetical protein